MDLMAAEPTTPIYSRDQLAEYLKFIGLGSSWETLEDVRKAKEQDPLKALDWLQRKQMAAVPFGNVALHYSQHHTISLDLQGLFHKIVRRRLGGYCLENNAFFAALLRSIGYEVLTTGGRVSRFVESGGKVREGFTGWSHMVLLVTINKQRYMVDVGFGASAACHPIELRAGAWIMQTPPSEGRLACRNISGSAASQKLWVFETRNDKESEWAPAYCFSELEFFPQDYEVMNFRTSQSRTSWFTYRLVLTKIILNEVNDDPIGNMTLVGGEVKRRLHGTIEVLKQCQDENERVEALNQWFGIDLMDEEIRGIRNMVSELK